MPVRYAQSVFASLWYAKPGAETGTVFIYAYWAIAALGPTSALILNRSANITGVNVNLTAAALAFTPGTPLIRLPSRFEVRTR